MVTSATGDLTRQLHKFAGGLDGGDRTDGQLVQAYLEHQDEAAFEALVRRHGPMVLGVCRRIAQNAQDAEDAFQATFLVLVRKAAVIVPPDQVGNWLYGVAYRTACKTRTLTGRRRTKERPMHDLPQREPSADLIWRDLRPLLDEELQQLPDKYRAPVVLCDLEGKTRSEAARQLGWPEGTLSWRLASARAMLARRLTRRGLTLSVGSLTLACSAEASAAVPAPLVASTVRAAIGFALGPTAAAGTISAPVAALTEGVLRTMCWTRFAMPLTLTLALTVVGSSLGLAALHTEAERSHPSAVAAEAQADERRPDQANQPRREAAPPTEAGRGRDVRKGPTVYARISAISADGKTLSVESGGRGDEAKKHEIKLTDKTVVEFQGVLKDLGWKLAVGDSATITLVADSTDQAFSIQATRPPHVLGKVTNVSADGNQVTLATGGRNRDEPANTKIKLTEGTKREFPRGSEEKQPRIGWSVEAWFADGSKDMAVAIRISRPRADGYGTITAIAADGKLLNLESKGRDGSVTKSEINVSDKTKLELVGADQNDDRKLRVGYEITFWFEEGTRDVATIVAEVRRKSPDLQGNLTSLSADGKVLTVEVGRRGAEPTKLEIRLTDQTRLEFAGTETAEEKKLTVGYAVTIWLQEGSKDIATMIRAVKPAPRGR